MAGGGDQATGAVGNGVVKSGIISSTIGTSGVIFAHMDKVGIDPHGRVHTFCHAIPGSWHIMGVTQSAGLSLQWMGDNFGSGTELASFMNLDPYELMSPEAEQAEPGCQGHISSLFDGREDTHLDPYARVYSSV